MNNHLIHHKGEHILIRLGQYLGALILGANDGLVSILGFVTGAYGATQNNFLVFITGIIVMAAAALSMGAGVFLSARAEREFYDGEKAKELYEIKHIPEDEKEEIRQIYREKGFRGLELEKIVKKITSNKEIWLSSMMLEELHLVKPSAGGEWKNALATIISFVIASLVPLLPYIIFSGKSNVAFWTSIFLTIAMLFTVGSLKTLITSRNWLKAGMEMVVVGSSAAGFGFLIGTIMEPILGAKISI